MREEAEENMIKPIDKQLIVAKMINVSSGQNYAIRHAILSQR